MQNKDNPRLTYTVDEVAKTLGWSTANAYKLTQTKGFPAIRIGKRIIVPKAGLHQWLEEQAAAGTPIELGGE